MTRLNTTYNYGSEVRNENPQLYNQLSDIYSAIANCVNTKPSSTVFSSDPPADSPNNRSYDVGDIFINSSNNTAWIMTSRSTNTAVVWKQIT